MTSNDDLPNILVIYADQMRADTMGCAGNPVIKTPYLDRMAQEGVRFTNAFVSYPAVLSFPGIFSNRKICPCKRHVCQSFSH
ncbi:MAG: sulfatase-like hydrolase/transferase [Deltaproteobacteria bacterium]|nr:sulfatase-like hydrolase/transferase [Deltaproteobacteria bacterium]